MNETGAQIRVVIVDDHALFRDGVNEILQAQPDIRVVGHAGSSVEALAVIVRERPDIVLLDVEIPGVPAAETVSAIRVRSPLSKIIVLTMYDGSQLVRHLLAQGIRGYLLKSVRWAELVAAVRAVHAESGRVILSVSQDCLSHLNESPAELLTAREREILELTADALSNRQIASALELTEATVKRHLRNIFMKLDAVSRIDAVNKAIAGAMIRPSAPVAAEMAAGRGHEERAPRRATAAAGRPPSQRVDRGRSAPHH